MFKQSILTKMWNYNFEQILYSYLRYTDSFLDVFFLLLAVILSELYEKKRLSHKKKYIEEFIWETSHFWLHVLFIMLFFALFSSCLSLLSTHIFQFYVERKFTTVNSGAPPCLPPPVSMALFLKRQSHLIRNQPPKTNVRKQPVT